MVATCPGFKIGETGPAGGVVIYVSNGTGSHGIERSKSYIGYAPWGCAGAYIGGTSDAFGTGQANTNAILAGCNEPNIAAKIADDYSLNGFDNWYLPSKAESEYGNLDGLMSSSEINGNNAWVRSQGDWRPNSPKNSSEHVYAIRNY